MIKKAIKRMLLSNKGIEIDSDSDINYGVKLSKDFRRAKIVDSKLFVTSMGDGCFFEHVLAYGNIILDRYVSISGPGTILHAVDGKISIGSFTSIAQNVSIQQFNHNMRLPTTYAVRHNIFNMDFNEDIVSKGDIIIGEDVWIGSNSVITSGVNIGRGAVIAAGAVVVRDVPPYTVVGRVPATIIKKRFSNRQIELLEHSKWWEWSYETILEKKEFFSTELE